MAPCVLADKPEQCEGPTPLGAVLRPLPYGCGVRCVRGACGTRRVPLLVLGFMGWLGGAVFGTRLGCECGVVVRGYLGYVDRR